MLPEALIIGSGDESAGEAHASAGQADTAGEGNTPGGTRKLMEAKARDIGHRLEKAGEAGMRRLSRLPQEISDISSKVGLKFQAPSPKPRAPSPKLKA